MCIRDSHSIMGLFPSANDFKAGKGVEKDAPRKTGVRRFFELVGRDMNRDVYKRQVVGGAHRQAEAAVHRTHPLLQGLGLDHGQLSLIHI